MDRCGSKFQHLHPVTRLSFTGGCLWFWRLLKTGWFIWRRDEVLMSTSDPSRVLVKSTLDLKRRRQPTLVAQPILPTSNDAAMLVLGFTLYSSTKKEFWFLLIKKISTVFGPKMISNSLDYAYDINEGRNVTTRPETQPLSSNAYVVNVAGVVVVRGTNS